MIEKSPLDLVCAELINHVNLMHSISLSASEATSKAFEEIKETSFFDFESVGLSDAPSRRGET